VGGLREHHQSLGIKYWEIGNEQNGNGFYGSQWEEDSARQQVATAYGSNAVLFINAMKAVDPTIKIGVGMVQPEHGRRQRSPPLPYNRCVLTNCGSVIDFVILHWYPGGSANTILASRPTSPHTSKACEPRSPITSAPHAPSDRDRHHRNGRRHQHGPVESLYCADEYLTWFENASSTWTGRNCTSGRDKHRWDVFGLPPAPYTNQQPYAPLYGATMAHLLATPGDQLVATTSGSSSLRVHATLRQTAKWGDAGQRQYVQGPTRECDH